MHVFAYTTSVITDMASPISASRELRIAVGHLSGGHVRQAGEDLIAAEAPPCGGLCELARRETREIRAAQPSLPRKGFGS
jgi:hypothetical protein